jgi:hypothetical protein
MFLELKKSRRRARIVKIGKAKGLGFVAAKGVRRRPQIKCPESRTPNSDFLEEGKNVASRSTIPYLWKSWCKTLWKIPASENQSTIYPQVVHRPLGPIISWMFY